MTVTAQRRPFNLTQWIDANRDLLKPPVCNAQLWQDAEFIVMVVGGPNARKDFHVNEGEELFFQVEGDITLRVMEDGQIDDIPIKQGEIFLLPPGVPHSPQRPANTVGLVIERKRRDGEIDRLRWYCDQCKHVLHEASFHLTDITKQLKPAIEEWKNSEDLRTCDACGTITEP